MYNGFDNLLKAEENAKRILDLFDIINRFMLGSKVDNTSVLYDRDVAKRQSDYITTLYSHNNALILISSQSENRGCKMVMREFGYHDAYYHRNNDTFDPKQVIDVKTDSSVGVGCFATITMGIIVRNTD